MWRFLFPKAKPAAVSPRPSPTLFFCLVGAFLLTLLPHVQQLPLWVSVGVVLGMILRSVGEVRRWPLPSSGFCGVLALCLLTAVYLQFHTIFGRDAGTAFMAALLAIKFFELRGARDVALIIFSSFFVVMSSLLYSQAVELFVYCLIMMWLLTALLLRNSMGDLPDDRLLRILRGSASIFLQAVPLAVFLFFFFPRYQGTLQLGLDDSSVGLTDKVEPGSISRLSDDESTAMTVAFSGSGVPSIDAMYWRALVLWDYHQGAWTPGEAGDGAPRSGGLPAPAPDSPTFTQVITIWPHFHRWLFALDDPVQAAEPLGVNGWSEALNGGVLRVTQGQIAEKERYVVTSAPLLQPQALPDELRRAALELPAPQDDDRIDPRVVALADRLKKGTTNADEYSLAILKYFRRGDFVYSDSPGISATLADFLFRTRKGFCEHYASAFAVLLRLGGYPARLVLGYHGAQYNPYKNLYIVKQDNAHSWDEVWIESERQWRRVDPTTVLPSGNSAMFPSSGQDGGAENESLSIELAHHRVTLVSSAHLPGWIRQAMLQMELRHQEIEADWDDWVFSYDPQAQSRLAQALGFGTATLYALGFVCLLATGVCAVVLGNLMIRKKPVSPVETFYAQFCRNMAQRGIPRAAWEGPLAYTERVAEAFPERRRSIRDAGQLVAQSRYSPTPPAATRDELKSLLLSITVSRAAAEEQKRRSL
jgi:hypothetical protein